VGAAVEFLRDWGLEGLSLDWEYPVCWQVDCRAGPAQDREGFTALLAELAAVFRPRGWTLSAAVSPSKAVMDNAYDIPAIIPHLDIINIMAYDYHGHWEDRTGHVAPLYSRHGDALPDFNVNSTVEHWLAGGAPADKLVLGIPLYGQSFTLADPARSEVGAATVGRGRPGEFTRAGGFLAYHEICRAVDAGWSVVQDPLAAQGPYAWHEDQWVGFDDVASVRRKAELVLERGLGGAMVWALDLDDFSGQCGCEKFPLLRTIQRVLSGSPQPRPDC